MADMRVFPQTYSVGRIGSDQNSPLGLRGTRDGAAFVADWKQSLIMEGRGFVVNVGAFSTPITGGGNGTVLDLDQPELVISVPSGTAILPIRVHVQAQTPLLAADSDESEILVAVDRTAAYNNDGTGTAETAFNLRTDNPRTSNCTIVSAFTADMTATTGADPVLGIELAHSVIVGDVQGTAATALWTKHDLLYEPLTVPIIMGPAMLICYWGGTVATTGFAEAAWLELPSTAFS